MRRPVEKKPECLLSLVIDAFGKVSLMPSTQTRTSSGVATSFASGHVALKVPSRAPPNCEKVILAPPFCCVQACVIQRFAAVVSNRLAVRWSGIEHQDSGRRSMRGERSQHGSLVVMREKEITIPGKDTVKAFAKRQCSHIGDDPLHASAIACGKVK